MGRVKTERGAGRERRMRPIRWTWPLRDSVDGVRDRGKLEGSPDGGIGFRERAWVASFRMVGAAGGGGGGGRRGGGGREEPQVVLGVPPPASPRPPDAGQGARPPVHGAAGPSSGDR